jgi:hypothetical protein
MIPQVRSWYSARRRSTKILVGVAGGFVLLALLYVVPRSVQYAGAARTPASLFVPEGAGVVVRVSDLAGRWSAAQQTEFWKTFTRRLQKDAAIRASLNEILAASGAPTVDQLEDRRWLERNPMMSEASLLRYAGRDFVLATAGDKFCVATRVGLGDFLLLPGLQLFPRLAGAERVQPGVLKRGDLYLSIQGAIVVASNDQALLSSALKRKGVQESPPGLVRATFRPQALVPTLRGFPLGAFFTVADLESCRRIDIDVEIQKADLVIRTHLDGARPRTSEPAPVDMVRMIPSNGLGACFTNIDAAAFWEWAKRIGDRTSRGGSPLDRFARESFSEFVEILANQHFAEEVVPKLDGPVSVIFGASQGEDGRTYAAIALCLRSSQPREAAEAVQGIIGRATEGMQDRFKPMDEEAGGVPFRSYQFSPDPFRYNNFLAPCYAATGDALILANNPVFLADALRCRANEQPPMAVQLHYAQAMRRLQELKMTKVLAAGAVESLFLYGPALRQGLEGFYPTVASKIVDNPRSRSLLRQELQTQAAKEGLSLTLKQLDDQWNQVMQERTRSMEEKLRGRARILDYLQWVAFQAEAVNDGMKFEFALELIK